MKGVPVCAEGEIVLSTNLPEEGAEFVTSRVAEENPLADCQRVESIVPMVVEAWRNIYAFQTQLCMLEASARVLWRFSTCLRHLGDRLAASPTSNLDLTPYIGEVVSGTQSVDTWETWDTYSNSQGEYI